MKNKIVGMAALVIGSIIILYFVFNWFKEFIAIDSCLDQGGRWNYELEKCELCDKDDISSYYWKTDFDEDDREFISKGMLLDSIQKSPDTIIAILNKRDFECSIELKEIRQDTITIQILNALYLSEQMGTTGAYCFLGETVFTLTELDSINRVKIEMEVGSHAGPGVYTRADFEGLLK